MERGALAPRRDFLPNERRSRRRRIREELARPNFRRPGAFVKQLAMGSWNPECPEAHAPGEPEMIVAVALEYANRQGILHREVKPSNILVESQDSKPVHKVIDFGLAKAIVLPPFEPEYAVGLRNTKEGVEAFVLKALSSIWDVEFL
jgi:serine/threonine protein kinase